MWATAVKEHDKNVAQKAIVSTKLQILVDQLTEKFGTTVKIRKKIIAITDSVKIDKALKKFATASTRDEVLKSLE